MDFPHPISQVSGTEWSSTRSSQPLAAGSCLTGPCRGKAQAGATGFPAKLTLGQAGIITGTRDSTRTERGFLLIEGEGGKISVSAQTSQSFFLLNVCLLC